MVGRRQARAEEERPFLRPRQEERGAAPARRAQRAGRFRAGKSAPRQRPQGGPRSRSARVGKYWPEIKSELGAQRSGRAARRHAGQGSQVAARRSRSSSPSPATNFSSMAGRDRETGPRAVVSLAPQASPALSTLLDQLPGSRQPKLLEALRARPARDVARAFPRPAPARQRPRGRSHHRGLPGRRPRGRSPGRGQPLHPRAQHHLRFPLLAL